MTRGISGVIGAALAIGSLGCGEPNVECGAQCPDISGAYLVDFDETPEPCSFTGLFPYVVIGNTEVLSISQDSAGGGSTTLTDVDMPPEEQHVPFRGTISVLESESDPQKADSAMLSGSFLYRDAYDVHVAITVSNLGSPNLRQVTGSVTTSETMAGGTPCKVTRTVSGPLR